MESVAKIIEDAGGVKEFLDKQIDPAVTLRDRFAMAALTGLIAVEKDGIGMTYVQEFCAEAAFELADLMLAARMAAR